MKYTCVHKLIFITDNGNTMCVLAKIYLKLPRGKNTENYYEAYEIFSAESKVK